MLSHSNVVHLFVVHEFAMAVFMVWIGKWVSSCTRAYKVRSSNTYIPMHVYIYTHAYTCEV